MKKVNIKTVNKVLHAQEVTKRYLRMKKKNWVSPTEQKLFKKHYGVITNELRSKVEIYQLTHNIYSDYFAYVNDNNITTFTGDTIGVILARNKNRTKDYITAKLINGKIYKGYYHHRNGDYCCLKLIDTK